MTSYPNRLLATLVVTLLSCGFLSRVPGREDAPTPRFPSSARCADPSSKAGSPAVTIPQFSDGWMSFLAESNRRNLETYSLFVRQMEVQSSLLQLSAGMPFGFVSPLFPSYDVASVAKLGVGQPLDLRAREKSAPQIFGGLMSDPRLKFLIEPAPESRPATGIASVAAAAKLGLAAGAPVAQVSFVSPSNLTQSKF